MNRKPNGAASTKNGNITMPKIHYKGLMNGYKQCHKENKALKEQAANQCMLIKRLENKIKKLEKQASKAIHVESLLGEILNVQEKENESRRHVLEEEKEEEIEFEDPPQCLGTDATRKRSKKRREPPAFPDNRNGDDLFIKDDEINREFQQWNNTGGHGIKQINYAQQRVMEELKCKMTDQGKGYLIFDRKTGKERSCIQIIFECYGLNIIRCREEIELLKECVTLRNDMTHSFGSVGYTKKAKQELLDGVVDILIKLKE